MLRVTRLLAARTINVGLPLAVELFHRDCRSPAGGKRAAQHLQALLVMRRVLVMFAEQHNRVAAQAVFPVVARRVGGAAGRDDDDDDGQAKRRCAPSVMPHCPHHSHQANGQFFGSPATRYAHSA